MAQCDGLSGALAPGTVPQRQARAFGDLRLETVQRNAFAREQPLELTLREWSILECLVLNAGRLVGKDRLMSAVSDWSDELTPNAIEVYVSRLRAKLGDAAHIRTVRGLGYRIDAHAG